MLLGEVTDIINGGGDLAVVLISLRGGKDGGGREITEERGRTVGNDLELKFDGARRGVPPTTVEGGGVFSEGKVDVLPHVNTGIGGVGHVKVDVDGGGVETGRVPFYVKVLARGDVLVHGRRFVEAASGAC